MSIVISEQSLAARQSDEKTSSAMTFAPELVGTFQDSEGGDGRHGSSPSMNGSESWRGSLEDGRERRLRCRLLVFES